MSAGEPKSLLDDLGDLLKLYGEARTPSAVHEEVARTVSRGVAQDAELDAIAEIIGGKRSTLQIDAEALMACHALNAAGELRANRDLHFSLVAETRVIPVEPSPVGRVIYVASIGDVDVRVGDVRETVSSGVQAFDLDAGVESFTIGASSASASLIIREEPVGGRVHGGAPSALWWRAGWGAEDRREACDFDSEGLKYGRTVTRHVELDGEFEFETRPGQLVIVASHAIDVFVDGRKEIEVPSGGQTYIFDSAATVKVKARRRVPVGVAVCLLERDASFEAVGWTPWTAIVRMQDDAHLLRSTAANFEAEAHEARQHHASIRAENTVLSKRVETLEAQVARDARFFEAIGREKTTIEDGARLQWRGRRLHVDLRFDDFQHFSPENIAKRVRMRAVGTMATAATFGAMLLGAWAARGSK